MTIESLIEAPQFSFTRGDRESRLLPLVKDTLQFHRRANAPFGALIDSGGFPNPATGGIAGLPYLPVRAFKELDLASVPRAEIVKVLTSSGTTGQAVSRINLDVENANRQQRALSAVMQTVLGPERLPMLIVDTKSVISSRSSFSARAAGVIGMMTFGRSHTWLLDDEMDLDRELLKSFLDKHKGQPFLIFGFTFMVWQYLLKALADGEVDFSQGVLIHSGGWKKLESAAVDNDSFKREWHSRTGLQRVRSFYGMVEQIGSTFIEGDDGWMYCPNFADVVIRRPSDWSVADPGEPGVIEVVSALPTSYPGNVLLTEDLGVSAEESLDGDWKGTRFKILGRLPKAELRGCSDTHAANQGAP
ncbi:acyl-protein synthetase [Humibacter antri]